MRKSYRFRFRPLLQGFPWFWSMSNNECWFGDPFPFISTEVRALHGQQPAVHCLSSKCGRDFPQNSFVFALLRAFCFCRFCSSLWIFRINLASMVKGSLVRKLPNYERLSQPAVAPSCQPHHHEKQIIMPPTSSWSRWEARAIGSVWMDGWKHFRARNPILFFGVKWQSVVAAGGSLLPQVRASIRKVVDKMCARL